MDKQRWVSVVICQSGFLLGGTPLPFSKNFSPNLIHNALPLERNTLFTISSFSEEPDFAIRAKASMSVIPSTDTPFIEYTSSPNKKEGIEA